MRTTAATKMNDTSSRSHAVFTLVVTQAQYDPATKKTGEKVTNAIIKSFNAQKNYHLTT